MSICIEASKKDKIIFLSKEDAEKPSSITLSESSEDDKPVGLITPDGEINWECPCLGGMAVGPCGVEFRTAFSCFHYSEEEMKGSDCFDKFTEMQDCMKKYPELYDKMDPLPEDKSEDDKSKDEQ